MNSFDKETEQGLFQSILSTFQQTNNCEKLYILCLIPRLIHIQAQLSTCGSFSCQYFLFSYKPVLRGGICFGFSWFISLHLHRHVPDPNTLLSDIICNKYSKGSGSVVKVLGCWLEGCPFKSQVHQARTQPLTLNCSDVWIRNTSCCVYTEIPFFLKTNIN